MADAFKSIKITQPNPGGPLVEQVVGAVDSSSGTQDAGKLVVISSTGQIDPTLVSGSGGGGTSTLLYPDDSITPIAGYHGLTVDPETATESAEVSPALAVIGTQYLIDQYATLNGYPALTILPAGTWTFNIWASTSDPTVLPVIDCAIYKISSPFTPGTEVPLFTATTPTITSLTPTPVMYTVSVTEPADILAQTDRLIMHIYARRTAGASATATVTFYHAGSLHYSNVSTPIPIPTSFSVLTSGVNNDATMDVGTGASLIPTGTGTVGANELYNTSGTQVTFITGGTPAHAGQLLISQPGGDVAFADPLVQGLFPPGTNTSTGNSGGPINPVLIGGSDYTGTPLLHDWKVDTSGIGYVNVTNSVSVSGTVAVTQSTSPWIVAGNLTHNNAAPAASNVGVLPAVASAANPTYNSGDQVLLSTDLSGALRVASSGTFTPALTSDRTQTGSITNTQSITVATNGGGAIVFNILGTWTGTIVFEYSVDGTNWVSANVNPYQSGTTVTSTTGNGQWTANVGGLNSFRVRGNTVTSGSATVWLEVGAGTSNAIIVMGTNASNVPKSLSLDGAGNLNVDTQAAVFASANGSAPPADAVWLGASDGTNLQGLLTEGVGSKNLRVAIFNGGNVAAVTGTNALKVDGSASPQPVSYSSGTFIVSSTALELSQGSTTSGQKGPLVQGAVTTNDPSYTTAQTDPLSLTTTGHLRTQDSAETSANGSTAVPTNALFVGAKGADGFLHGLKSSTNDGALDVNATFSGTVTPGFVTDITQSGSITNTQNVTLVTSGAASVVFNITGTWTGTIVFEASVDGTNWVPSTCYAKFPGGAGVTSATANGQWTLPVGGVNSFRVRGNTVTSGTATAWLEKGAGGLAFESVQTTAANLNATVVQGTAGTIAQSWFVKVTDGSNVFGTTTTHPLFVEGTLTHNNAAPAATSNIGALTALANAAAPTYTEGDQVLLSTDLTGALRIASSGTFTPALTADRTSTGNITTATPGVGNAVLLSTQGTGATIFNITGSWNGTLQFEVSIDGTNFVAAKCLQRYPTTGPLVSSLVQNGSTVTQWSIATGGVNSFRVRASAWTSGTATVWEEGGAGAQDAQMLALISDGTNLTAVKAGATVPTTTDNAVVVSLSPNSAQFATSTTANALPGTNPQTIGVTSSSVVNSNASRKEVVITNVGTTVIFLGLGQTPTNTAYHIALAACSTSHDGTGGTWTSDMWKGAVNAISSAGGGLVNLTELT